ncbi:MAG: MraY family glycosyltransferase [Desulfitobacteriaceae bacterium]|nr:MraY family glycosyltransferase [Desulfitobacteriaceae bacterium]MDD4347234.1 MraY family glycosyltransferase [Desulfitobacteriaceae bacterium]MDD4401129.1 MraY family glycosyltransferase [Desulfitobacteriaceae bacterium]
MIKSYILIFSIALIVAILVTPFSIFLARRWGAIDYPGGRRIHQQPIPRLGGLAIYAAFWLAVMLTQRWENQYWGLFLGSTVIFLVGVWDDIKGIRPLIKLFGQILAAVILVLYGFSFSFQSLPLFAKISNLGVYGIYLGAFLTVFWVVGLVNTINISDGLDGLAAGICFGAALLLFWSAYRTGQIPSSFLTLALAGATLGFLFYNFHPARVFMGDSGSMFLGYLIGGISIMGLLKTATVLGLVFPLLVLALPLTDMVFAIIRRKWKGISIAKADRGHLHHRLLDAGLSQRTAVFLLYVISACFGIAAVLLTEGYLLEGLVLFLAELVLLVYIFLRRYVYLLKINNKRNS